MKVFTGGEFIVMGVPGETLDAKTLEIIKKVQPSGFILFARNIKSPQQLRELTDRLRAAVDHEPIITIDQEGGRVSRLKEFMTEPPSARQFARHGDVSKIREHGVLTGKLLRFFGFNLNLAPVLDVEIDAENDNSLGERTYGKTPDQVVENALAFAEGMHSEKIISCGKHFPGYSRAVVDPHNALPTVDRTKEEMLENEWIPFQRMFDKVDTLMIGHVTYPLIDSSKLPASLAPNMVRGLVRNDWKFKGCTITDDMDMGAINKTYGSAEAAKMALEAGNDIMLVCHNIEGIPKIAENLASVSDEYKQEAFARIQKLRERLAPPTVFSMDEFKKLDASVKALRDSVIPQTANV